MNETIRFLSFTCRAVFERYMRDQSIAIQLVAAADDEANEVTEGEPIATATTCLAPNYTPPEGHVVVKDYSENAGMVEALIAAGVIERTPYEVVNSGFVRLRVWKLTPPALQMVPPVRTKAA